MTAANDLEPITVEGHTDTDLPRRKVGKNIPYKWELSSARASEVVKYLIAKV